MKEKETRKIICAGCGYLGDNQVDIIFRDECFLPESKHCHFQNWPSTRIRLKKLLDANRRKK